MIVRILKYLRGYVRIKIEGYSPERLLNLCNANGLLIWDVMNQGLIYELCISVKDYRKLRPYARKTGTRITILKRNGFPFFMNRFRKRRMFFAGMFLCAAIVYGLSFFVWSIQIEGNITQTEEELVTYLESMGVTFGTKKSKVICENLETELRKAYPNILWVSAEMRGTKIILQIKENEDQDIISKVQEKNLIPLRMIAETAGVVESMIVRQGTPKVSAGDEVTCGQVLVEGYYELKNDAGEVIRYEGVTADADIVIKTTEYYQDRFSMEYDRKNYTNRKRLGICVGLFDKTINFQPKIPFEKYDRVSDVKKIFIAGNEIEAFFLEFTWYLEYKPEKCVYTAEQATALAKDRYSNKYKNILQKGVQIIEKDVKIDINGKLCIVGGYVTLRVPVTKKVPAIIPEISMDISGEGEH